MNKYFQKMINCFERRRNNRKLIHLMDNGDYDEIRAFLDITPDHLFDINTCDGIYNNSYLLGCKIGSLDILKLLEHRGADKQKINARGENGLLIASANGHIDILPHLIGKVKLNVNKLDVYGNNAYILASKNGKVKVLKYLEQNTELDILHTNHEGRNAFSIHRYLCSCPETIKVYENMRLSVTYLAQNGYPVLFSGHHKFIADIYYQLYYRLKPSYYSVSKYDGVKCNICKAKFYDNQTILKCKHNHISHVNCFVAKACKSMCIQYGGFNHNSYPEYAETCIECNQPWIMKQENIRIIRIN
jgi:hypothetical protein